MIPIQQLINQSLKEKNAERGNKPIVSWHCSSLGSCLRGIYLKRQGKLPDTALDERTLRVFDMGNKIEDWLVGLIEKQPDVKVETQVRIEDKELGVSGYADMVIEYEGEKQVYEIKSKHSKSFWWMKKKGEGASRHNMQQLWIYLKVLGIDKGNLIYVSKDDSAILEYPVLLSDKSLEKEVMEQLTLLNKAWKEQDIFILPLPKEGDWLAKYCSHHKQCVNPHQEKLIK